MMSINKKATNDNKFIRRQKNHNPIERGVLRVG